MSVQVDIRKTFGDPVRGGFALEMAFDAGAETLGLLGASGCGKSVTLRCIAGIVQPDEGRIVVDGVTFFDRAAGRRARVDLKPQQRRTALLFQNYQLFPHLRVAENIAAGIPRSVDKEQRGRMVHAQLQRFGLLGLERRYPAQLSGGQQQRVALGRMLAAQPRMLMLDEPFSALDPHLKSELEQDLLALFARFEGTVLYVSHDIDEAYRFCSSIAVVNDGTIDELAPKAQVINHPSSLAAIKLSGCKNTTRARKAHAHAVWLPQWGVRMECASAVPDDAAWLGVRAFHIRRLSEPEALSCREPNVFRMRCDRISDTRFERTVMASFVDGYPDQVEHSVSEDESLRFFKTHVRWNIDKHMVPDDQLPEQGDVVWLQFPADKLYVVTR